MLRDLSRPGATFATPLSRDNFVTRDMMRKWQCMTCGFIYDEAEGWPDDNVLPGTRWEDVPDEWICPECGTPKSDFEMVELG